MGFVALLIVRNKVVYVLLLTVFMAKTYCENVGYGISAQKSTESSRDAKE